jgi:hypothetical protein
MKRCNTKLAPDRVRSPTTTAYYFQVGYKDENGKNVVSKCTSFFDIDPMSYEVVLYKINNSHDKDLYHIVDIKNVENKNLQIPEVCEENFLFILQKKLDEYILETTGMRIYGMNPIKAALIIQTIMQRLNMELKANIQLVGDKSSGKSLVLDYYCCLLNGGKHKLTDGGSISLPALRGTKKVTFIFNKQIHTVTKGYLGQYYSITINEAGENLELVKQLKMFLMKSNYGYSKEGGQEVSHVRTAHVNLSENINDEHIALYRGSIKKAYKELSVKIGNEDIPLWDESWDLHKPLYMYDNLYLRKVVEEKRIDNKQKKIYWIDGYSLALHDRFPFYFYIVNEKKDEILKQIISENSIRSIVNDENILKALLRSDSLEEFFESLKEYTLIDDDPKALFKAEEIFEEYNLELDSRIRDFWYKVLRISRIINKRKIINEDDYNLLRWFIEKTNCKLDVTETIDYNIVGPPDKAKEKVIQTKIEEAKNVSEMFGLPLGEF